MRVRSITTDSTGSFEFSSLVPGKYTLNATKANATTGNLDYSASQATTLKANTTSTVNISLGMAPVTVTGKATHNGTGVSSIRVSFAPNTAVKNNTAVSASATSDKNGSFTASVVPGAYNVSVKKTEGATTVYSFQGSLTVQQGQGSQTYNIALAKESTTVTGTTTYNAASKANVTVVFSPDGSLANNSAVRATAKSNATGRYAVELAPGLYNVTVNMTANESGASVTYLYIGHLQILPSDLAKTHDVALLRREA
jgi:hypothetical protein